MSAFHALDAACAAGIEVRLDGQDLVLSGSSAPPTEVVDMLRRHKLSIVSLLQPTSASSIAGTDIAGSSEIIARQWPQGDEWSPEDWQAFFNERVGIAEFDGGLQRPAAEARAFDSCVAQWLCFKLVITQPGPCPICGDLDRPNDPLLAIGMIGGRYWLHIGCVKAWCTARRAEAVSELATLGIRGPEGNST